MELEKLVNQAEIALLADSRSLMLSKKINAILFVVFDNEGSILPLAVFMETLRMVYCDLNPRCRCEARLSYRL